MFRISIIFLEFLFQILFHICCVETSKFCDLFEQTISWNIWRKVKIFGFIFEKINIKIDCFWNGRYKKPGIHISDTFLLLYPFLKLDKSMTYDRFKALQWDKAHRRVFMITFDEKTRRFLIWLYFKLALSAF